MKNRLEIAKQLLSDDGNIVIQSDWNETHYLKVLMDEIFGRENFLNEIIWYYEKWTTNSKNLQKNHDNIIVYSKNKGNHKFNIVKEITNNLKEKYEKGYLFGGGGGSKGLVVYDKDKPKVKELIESGKYKVVYAKSDGKPLSDVWSIPFINPVSKERTGFNSQKPEKLIERILKVFTNKNDIVLDFCLGSGTTAAVAHKMGRQYIGIEQMNYIEDIVVERLKKVIDGEQGGISKSVEWKGGGEFIYLELKKYNQNFIEKIEKAKTTEELLKIWEEMKVKSFLDYNLDIKKQEEYISEFKKLKISEQKQHLCEILDKNQLYVNLSSLEDKDFLCTDEEKQITKEFYGMED